MLWGALESTASLTEPWNFKLFGVAGRKALAEGECLAQRSLSWKKDSAPAFPSRSNFPLPLVKPDPESTFGPNWCKFLTLSCRKVNAKPKTDACGVSGTAPFKGSFFPSLLSHPRSNNNSGGTVSLVEQAAIN